MHAEMKTAAVAVLLAIAGPVLAQDAGAAKPNEQYVKLGEGAVRSPFTKATVLKLNAIVRRSQAAIDSYDGTIAATRATVAAAMVPGAPPRAMADAKAAIGRLEKLCKAAASAHADMEKAKAKLEASGEEYNPTILAGMEGFTIDVDNEIKGTADKLTTQLAAH